MRVRCFTQDDAHIFMLPSQIKDEIKGVIALIDKVYSLLALNIIWNYLPSRKKLLVPMRFGIWPPML